MMTIQWLSNRQAVAPQMAVTERNEIAIRFLYRQAHAVNGGVAAWLHPSSAITCLRVTGVLPISTVDRCVMTGSVV